MPKFAANLTMLFAEHPFLDRFRHAREAGFSAVEFQFPYEYPLDDIVKAVQQAGLEVVMFNLPSGDWRAGDRGIANDPRRVDEFRAGVAQAVEWARALKVRKLNCIVGKRLEDVPLESQEETLVANLRFAAQALEQAGIELLIEPLNHYDVPGFWLTTSAAAQRLVERVGAGNLRIQYDVYHMQRMEGELANTIRRLGDQIGHVQIADNPGRHQPGTGEIRYEYIFQVLDETGYDGFVSLEYVPVPDTLSSLKWLQPYRQV